MLVQLDGGMARSDAGTDRADLSMVMACYNEQDVIGVTIPQLIAAFRRAGYRLELVAVDNGSNDRTGEIIQELMDKGWPVVTARVDKNVGYGQGALCGINRCSADWIGFIPADLQVDPADVVKLYEAAATSHGHKLFKIRRRFRLEGPVRRLVSASYNLLTMVLFGKLGTSDINGTPKLLARSLLERMHLQSHDWFIDAEMMIKAKALGEPVFEINAFSQMRPGGQSNVRVSTCWEFLLNLFKYRFTRKRELLEVPPAARQGGPAADRPESLVPQPAKPR